MTKYKLVWHTFAGGTGAAPGKKSYQSSQTEMGQYNIDPISYPNGRHRYYATHFINNRGARSGGLWQQIHTGDMRTGKRIAREHFDRISRGLEPVSEMHERENIKRRKNPVKKKRSAKQLANDKRLGRMAKKRAKVRRKKTGRKRTVGRKKTTYRKKRNPGALRKAQTAIQRATNPKRSAKSHLWYVFKCYGKSVRYLGLTTGGKAHWTIRDAAVIWKTKSMAATVARSVAKWRGMAKYDIGVASANMTSAQIAAGCQKGKA